jgi:competence protein ComEA
MKQLLLASLLSILFVPHFSYAADNAPHHAVTQSEHHRAHSHTGGNKSQYTQPVDINQADATELATLKGIGPKKATAIVAYRTAHGSFKTVNDLSKVKGIGAKSVARLESKNPGRLSVNIGKKVG